MADFTPTQGRYLGFIQAYVDLHGYPPTESEIAEAMRLLPPAATQMLKMLEKKGLISRQPGQARSLKVLVPEDQIPPWGNRMMVARPARVDDSATRTRAKAASPPANLYVLSVYLRGGPMSDKFTAKNRVVCRWIEIRGDQTLEDLHEAIFGAFDRFDPHLYEFQFGKRPNDPAGPNYGISDPGEKKPGYGDARTTKLDDLELKRDRVFDYWFDFGHDWFHQVQVDRIESAIPTVTYPRVIKRQGKSPPQYADE